MTSRDDPCCTTGALARHFVDAARRQPLSAATRGFVACDGAPFGPPCPCCECQAAHAFVRMVDRKAASARNSANRQETPKLMRPGPTPAGVSVANVRDEAARHRMHDAHPALGAARRLAMRRRPCRSDRGTGLADEPATRLTQARAHDMAERPAHFAPTGEEKNGRRPHRCLQSEREVALRRPRNPDHGLRRRPTQRMQH